MDAEQIVHVPKTTIAPFLPVFVILAKSPKHEALLTSNRTSNSYSPKVLLCIQRLLLTLGSRHVPKTLH